MIDIKKISLEQKSSAVFSLSAFILSFIIGFLSGVKISVVLLRSFTLGVLFALIGFGTIFVIKRFVPEVYRIIQGSGTESSEENIDAELEYSEEAASVEEEQVPIPDKEIVPEAEEADKSFKELGKEDFSQFKSDEAADISPEVGKMGKHIVVKDDHFAQYEPKLMAQAVRTMLKRDED